MAEQNRKTEEERDLRERAGQVAEDYIDFLLVAGAQDDIAN